MPIIGTRRRRTVHEDVYDSTRSQQRKRAQKYAGKVHRSAHNAVLMLMLAALFAALRPLRGSLRRPTTSFLPHSLRFGADRYHHRNGNKQTINELLATEQAKDPVVRCVSPSPSFKQRNFLALNGRPRSSVRLCGALKCICISISRLNRDCARNSHDAVLVV